MAENIEGYVTNENISNIKEELEGDGNQDNKIFVSEPIVRIDGSEYDENAIETKMFPEVCYNNTYNDVKTEVFVPDIKTELNKVLMCDNCHEDYQDYCTKCGMLEHILNSCNDILDKAKLELPTNILEIRKSYDKLGIFALKIIPEGVKFGPFTGLATSGNYWKINDGKLKASDDKSVSLNWMQYINCVRNVSEQNLTVFQHQGGLYYRSVRKIWEGEELLVYFGEKHEDCVNRDLELEFIPRLEQIFRNVYACILCCLGFSAKSYLLEHNTVCPYGTDEKFLTRVFTQCQYCDVYLEEKQYFEYHRNYCAKNARQYMLPEGTSDVVGTDGLFSTYHKYTKWRRKMYKCTQCSYETDYKAEFRSHIFLRYNVKLFSGSSYHSKLKLRRTYKTKFRITDRYKHKDIEYRHIKYEVETNPDLENMTGKHEKFASKCLECDYAGIYNSSSQVNISVKHSKEENRNSLEGDFSTNSKLNLKRHKKCNRSNRNVDCKTNRKSHLKGHRNVYGKPFSCLECDYVTKYKANLKNHISGKHSDQKSYKCLECDFMSNYKKVLLRHINGKSSNETAFTCSECGFKTCYKKTLKLHVMGKHSEEKTINCSECDFKTFYKSSLKRHANVKHPENKVINI